MFPEYGTLQATRIVHSRIEKTDVRCFSVETYLNAGVYQLNRGQLKGFARARSGRVDI